MFQEVIVVIVLAACVAFTAHRLWRRFHAATAGDIRCAGCPLADTCAQRHKDTCCHTGTTTCDCCKA